MPMHYKGATREIKTARWNIRQAERILRLQYHGASDVALLDKAHAYLSAALEHIAREIDAAMRQLRIPEESRP